MDCFTRTKCNSPECEKENDLGKVCSLFHIELYVSQWYSLGRCTELYSEMYDNNMF